MWFARWASFLLKTRPPQRRGGTIDQARHSGSPLAIRRLSDLPVTVRYSAWLALRPNGTTLSAGTWTQIHVPPFVPDGDASVIERRSTPPA